MRVLLVTHEYPPYSWGGFATYMFVLHKLLRLSDEVNEITILAGARGAKEYKIEYLDNKTKIYYIPYPSMHPDALWFQCNVSKYLLKYAERYDVIHANQSTISSILNKLPQQYKNKIVITIHSSHAYFTELCKLMKRRPKYGLLELVLHCSAASYTTALLKNDLTVPALIFVAYHVMKEVEALVEQQKNIVFGGNTYVIYNTILPEEFDKLLPRTFKVRDRDIVFVGRLTHEKGVLIALEAIKKLAEIYRNGLKLHIYGTGYLKPYIHKIIVKEKLFDKVLLYSYISRQKLFKIIRRYAILIVPSVYEGCPFNVIEANAAGLSVVAFDLAWSREFIVNSFNGLRVSSLGDPTALAEGIKKVIEGISVKRRVLIAEYTRKRFDPINVLNKILDVYSSLNS